MLIFAHRGAADSPRSENTIAAFRRARAAGRALETDARLSSDGRVVLIHDSWVRGIPPRSVRQMTAARLGKIGVPTIDDLYAQLGTDFDISIDLKVTATGPALIAAADQARATQRMWLVSEDLRALRELRALDRTVRLVHESRAGSYGDQRQHTQRLSKAGVNAQNTDVYGWTAEAVEITHRSGLLAFGSLANDAARFTRAAELGIDAIYTDHLDLPGRA